jgi:hypothetical protein
MRRNGKQVFMPAGEVLVSFPLFRVLGEETGVPWS